MAAKITNGWIADRIKATIDQHFALTQGVKDKEYAKIRTLHNIGGILQTALHLLPLDKYEECKMYCYEKYGYDPGGCREQTISVFELMAEDDMG